MNGYCAHQWVECSATVREVLRPSEYGGWLVDQVRYFICRQCFFIQDRPIPPRRSRIEDVEEANFLAGLDVLSEVA